MKRLLIVFSLTLAAWAQPRNPVTVSFVDPTGLPCQSGTGVIYAVNGAFFTCQSLIYTQITGGSGTFNALTGDATSTANGGATVIRGINGVLMSSLGTGLLKNTTGIPSIAVAGTDYQAPIASFVSSLNSQTGAISLGIGTAGTSPGWSTSTLNIPFASATSVTAGLLSKIDYDLFSAKAPAASPTLSGTITLSSITGLTQCLQVNAAGVLTGTGLACGGGGSFTALSGDAISTATGGATIVKGANSVIYSTLATGLVKNTNGTGAPSIATSTDVLSTFSGTCNSTTFVRGDGSCVVAGGTFTALTGDATSTATGGATVVKGVNSVLFSTLGTGILKNTTTTGVPSIAIAADFPTLNQSTTGNAATATALATIPTICGAGNYPLGVDIGGNARNCTAAGGGAFSALTGDAVSTATGGATVVRWPELSAYQLPTPAVLDGVTDDSAAFNSAVAGTTILVPQGKTARVTNLTLANNVTIRCGAGAILSKVAASTTTYMFNLTGTNQTVQGCILEGNSIVQTTGQLYLMFANGATNLKLLDNTWQNTGSPSNTMGGVLAFSSSILVERNSMNATVAGTQIKIDARPGKSNRVRANTLSGSQANAIQITDSNGYSVRAQELDVEVSNNSITGVTDGFSGTGQNGNAITVFQADGVRVMNNYIKTVRFSCVRSTLSADVNVGFNMCDGAQESSMYAELGSIGNNFHDNHIINFVSGINLTNVSARSPDQTNVALNNVLVNGTAYGIKGEHDNVSDNTVDSVPFCYLLGFGATTHDNSFRNNACTHANAAYTPVVAAIGVDQGITAGADVINGLTFSGTVVAPGAFPTNLAASISISAITQAVNGVVTFSTGTQPVTGETVCFYTITGMSQINGLCPTVASSTATTVTLNLNTTAFSAFVAPTGGQKASATIIYSASTTPKYTLPTSLAYVRVDSASKALTSSGGFRSAGTVSGSLILTGVTTSSSVTQLADASTTSWSFTWPQTAPVGIWRDNFSSSELSGDATTSGTNVVTVGKVNGISISGTPAVGYIPTATSASAATWQAPSAGGGMFYSVALGTILATTVTNFYPVSSIVAAVQTASTKTVSQVPKACSVQRFQVGMVSAESAGGNTLTVVATLQTGSTPTVTDSAATCTMTTTAGGAIAAGSSCVFTPGTVVSLNAGDWWTIKIVNNTAASTGFLTTALVCQ